MLHTRDADAIEFSTPEAQQYAVEVEALGRQVREMPVMELVYGPDRGQRLDVYAPAGARGLPILVFFHGGSWINGHRGWVRFMAPSVLQLPAILVAGTYRLAPRLRWPAQFEDVREGLACVARRAAEFGGDASRIVVSGHSAGAHLATLIALKRQGPPLLASFPISCSHDLQYGEVALDSQEGRVYRYLFSERSQDADASPINFVRGNTTRFHVLWGERDLPRIIRSSERFVAAMAREPGELSHAVIPDANHFDCHLRLRDPAHPWYAELARTFRTRASG